jgi:hypothetical protein
LELPFLFFLMTLKFPYATQTLRNGFHDLGYDHISVDEQRGAIVIRSESMGRIARLMPLGSKNRFQLYFRDRNDKRWEAAPIIGDAKEMLRLLSNEFSFWLTSNVSCQPVEADPDRSS